MVLSASSFLCEQTAVHCVMLIKNFVRIKKIVLHPFDENNKKNDRVCMINVHDWPYRFSLFSCTFDVQRFYLLLRVLIGIVVAN